MEVDLTVVIGYRDRDLERVKRCLDSLAGQARPLAELIFVDYGSAPQMARAARELVERYTFARYIYTETRGYPWNRAHCLNIGVRRAQTEFVVTSDIDVIFPSQFSSELMACVSPGRVVYCRAHNLPKGFSKWDKLRDQRIVLNDEPMAARGICQCVPRQIWFEIRGFDETYQYWGIEDRDLHTRLMKIGLEELWLDEPSGLRLFHQWHPPVNHVAAGFMPEGVWSRMEAYFWGNADRPLRNESGWGGVLASNQRPILPYLERPLESLLQDPAVTYLDLPPADSVSIGRFTKAFTKAPSGHLFVVDHANYPRANVTVGHLLRRFNRLLHRLGINTGLEYSHNVLHAHIAYFIEAHQDKIADYFLGHPDRDGLTFLLKK